MPSRYTQQSLRRRTGAYGDYDDDDGANDIDDEGVEDGDYDADAMFDALIPDEVEEDDDEMDRDATMATVNNTMDDFLVMPPTGRPPVRTRSQTARATAQSTQQHHQQMRREFQQPAQQQRRDDGWFIPMPTVTHTADWEEAARILAGEERRERTAQSPMILATRQPLQPTTVEESRANHGDSHHDESTDCGDTTCPICFIPLAASGEHRAAALAKCGHLFGKSCIEMWIRQQGRAALCPFCKAPTKLKDVIGLFVKNLRVADNSESDELRSANEELKNAYQQLVEENTVLKKVNNEMSIKCEQSSFDAVHQETIANRRLTQCTKLQGQLRESDVRATTAMRERDERGERIRLLERELDEEKLRSRSMGEKSERYLIQVKKLQGMLSSESKRRSTEPTLIQDGGGGFNDSSVSGRGGWMQKKRTL